MKFKEKTYSVCVNLLTNKINDLTLSLQDLIKSGDNDSKSSAGDKHETSRAMMQLEYEKISFQLQKAEYEKKLLQEIDLKKKSQSIIKGSLVETDKGLFFLSVAIGGVVVGKQSIIVLSMQSPLGQKLNGLKVNDVAEINGLSYRIIRIL